MIIELVEKSLQSLIHWKEKYGDVGYDPYDIKCLNDKMLRRMQAPNKLGFSDKLYRYFIIEFADKYFPLMTRHLYKVKPKTHSAAQGLFFDTYLNLFTLYKQDHYHDRAMSYRKWLIEDKTKFYPEFAWGAPVKWRSDDIVYEIGEPFAVTSAWIGNAFYKNYKQFSSQEDLGICISICEFFINHLIISEIDKNRICFSYSALKETYINNSNLFVAEFLIRIGQEINNSKYIDYGTRAANYSISNQLESGVIPYFGPEENKAMKYDLYHSGYEIRCLYSIYKYTQNKTYLEAVSRYFDFFRTNYLKGTRIQTKANSTYPIDITSAAETILLLNHIEDDFSLENDHYEGIVKWIINTLQTKDGYFIYGFRKPGIKIRIPFLRWGEAWMALALSETMLKKGTA